MSKEKQIDEMDLAVLNCYRNKYYTDGNSTEQGIIANAINEVLPVLVSLKNAGYRKQSENTVEIVRCKECRNCEKVPSILGTVLYCNEWCKDVAEDTFCSFGAKMKGGAE